MTADTVTIEARFNGPLDSGNGGYSAGTFAAPLEGPVEVTLRTPVPLDIPLTVERDGEDALRVLNDDALVAEARRVDQVDAPVPAPVSVEDARRASEGYRGLSDGTFSRCFVCGRGRDDNFGVFAGDVEGRDLVASTWTPPQWTADDRGSVRPEFVWAVLDCPAFFAAHMKQDLSMAMLGRMTVLVERPVPAGEERLVIAWPIERDGRKRIAGSAVLSAAGETLAVARVLMIEPRSQAVLDPAQ